VLVCGPLGLFIQNVTAGRGWVALALVVFAGWRPVPCVLGALLFGVCDALQLRIQGTDTSIPYEVFLALPYAVTLLVMVLRARSNRTPSALGVAFDRRAA
jgi:simple sugar transport system permease protein